MCLNPVPQCCGASGAECCNNPVPGYCGECEECAPSMEFAEDAGRELAAPAIDEEGGEDAPF